MSHDELRAALDTLAKAHGAKELAEAHASLQAAVRRKRKQQHEKFGDLATAVKDALLLRDQMKAAGASPEDLNRGLEAVLREKWPRLRAEPWHFHCTNCQDYGGEILECPAVPCERTKPHGPHSYLRPCFCKSRKFSTERKAPEPTTADNSAAKSRKPEKFFRG